MSNIVGYSLGCVTPVRYDLTQGEDATGNTVAFSSPPICRDPPRIIVECKKRSGTATLCGHSEFAQATGGVSSPPKKYRKKVANGIMEDCAWGGLICSGAPAYGAKYVYSGECSYSQSTCAIANSLKYTEYNDPGCPATLLTVEAARECTWGDTTNPSSSDCLMTIAVSKTRVDRSGTNTCCDRGSGRATRRTGSMYWELSEEDTELDAEARATGAWSAWAKPESCVDCCTAFRTARTTGFSFPFQAAKFRLGITDGIKAHSYQVAVDYERREIGASAWVVVATEYFTVVSQPQPVIDPPEDPPVEPPVFHDTWPDYDVPQLAGYETRVTNVRHHSPE